jgi:uncharacterized protein (DUF1330 family)
VTDVHTYLTYMSRLPETTEPYGARPIAFGRFLNHVAGDLEPRQILFLVEWESEEAFNRFRDDPDVADLHPLREDGTSASSYIWQTFEGIELLDPDLSLDELVAMLTP